MSVPSRPSVAYFCMEYGLSPDLPIYSGGLGILAGDHMKSVGDLSLPVTGIGLFWSEGYTRQIIDPAGDPQDHYPAAARDALTPLDVQFEVTVREKPILCHAYRVNRHTRATLYLIEPVRPEDQWMTRRLYSPGQDDRLAQELLLGVGGVRLLDALGHVVDVYHFNEGHAVFAGLELIRRRCEAGERFADAWAEVRKKVVFTTHTPVPAGNEVHEVATMRRMSADLGFSDRELAELGENPFSMTVAGLRLSCRANGVAELHGETARAMWRTVAGAAPIIAITNGVHAPTWQDARVRAATVPDKGPDEQRRELWDTHQELKAELLRLIGRRTGTELDPEKLLIGFARRAATYKRADLIFGEPKVLEKLFFDHGVQLVFSGKAHPADYLGKSIVRRLVDSSRKYPRNVVFLENYDMTLGAALTRGCDVWLNNPRWPKEASGTSGMKAAMNGVLNLSILDGWWPEGCRHGETGWQIGAPDPKDAYGNEEVIDRRDRDELYRVLAEEVVPRYYRERDQWIRMMQASIAMSQWRFSSDRMLQEYFARLYQPGEP